MARAKRSGVTASHQQSLTADASGSVREPGRVDYSYSHTRQIDHPGPVEGRSTLGGPYSDYTTLLVTLVVIGGIALRRGGKR